MPEQALTVYDLTPGKVVGERYEVVGSHRQGGLSTAFEMKDRENGERCEMQLFPAALFEYEGQMQEFSASWAPWKRVNSDSVLRGSRHSGARRRNPRPDLRLSRRGLAPVGLELAQAASPPRTSSGSAFSFSRAWKRFTRTDSCMVTSSPTRST